MTLETSNRIKLTEETINSKPDKNRRGFTVTLEQLKAMNLDPFMERALFGRTSEEWEKQLRRGK